MADLQTAAFPLGYPTTLGCSASPLAGLTLGSARLVGAYRGPLREGLQNIGAADRSRTGDLVLGKHALYQLSYSRMQT